MIVLLVGAEAIPALELAMSLEDAGHVVLGPVFADGPALDLAAERQPDIALIDARFHRSNDFCSLAHILDARWGIGCLIIREQNEGLARLGAPRQPDRRRYPSQTVLTALNTLLATRRGPATNELQREPLPV